MRQWAINLAQVKTGVVLEEMGLQMIKNEGWRNTSKQATGQQASSGRLGGWFCDVGDGRVARRRVGWWVGRRESTRDRGRERE